MKKRELLIQIVMNLLIAIPCILYVWVALYTFPSQDDFAYTAVVNGYVESGHGLLTSPFLITMDRYLNYRGYFLSCFLYYFFDAILQCSVTRTRLFCALFIILFYISLYFFIDRCTKKVMKLSITYSLLIKFVVFTCMNCTFYYYEHEAFYWPCSVQVTLIPLVMIFFNYSLAIVGVDSSIKWAKWFSALTGLLLGGALPNVAVVASVLCVLVVWWTVFIRKETIKNLLSMLPLVIGGLLNVLAPSTFKTVSDNQYSVLKASKDTFVFLGDRVGGLLQDYPIIGVLLISLTVLLLTYRNDNSIFSFSFPILFTIAIILIQFLVSFPVVYVYGLTCSRIMQRTLFVSDLIMYISVCGLVYYWTGWIKCKFAKFKKINWNKNILCVSIVAILIVCSYMTRYSFSIARVFVQLYSGKVAEFGTWSDNIIQQVKASDDDIVIIYDSPMEENTPLRWPYYHFGEYDPDTEFTGNSSMAMFFNKKAIFILEE